MRNQLQPKPEDEKQRRRDAAKTEAEATSETAALTNDASAVDAAFNPRLSTTNRQNAVMRMQQTHGNAAVQRMLAGRAPKGSIQRAPHAFPSINNPVFQVDGGPVLAVAAQQVGNITGIFSDTPLWDQCTSVQASITDKFGSNFFAGGRSFTAEQVIDPGVMYPNYRVTVRVDLLQDGEQAQGAGSTATVGSSSAATNSGGTSAGTSNTATASATGGQKDVANATAGGGTGSTTGTTNGSSVTGGGTMSQTSGSTIYTANAFARVTVTVTQFDRLAVYHVWGNSGSPAVVNVGTVTYTAPTMAAPATP